MSPEQIHGTSMSISVKVYELLIFEPRGVLAEVVGWPSSGQ